jgi:hypothetical protein
MTFPLVRSTSSAHSAQILSFITPLLIGGPRVGRVVSACLLSAARSRWRNASRQLIVNGGGNWGKSLFVKGELAFGSSTGVGLGEAVMAQGGAG